MTKRAILSCDSCRSRKVRCDKGEPCTGCRVRGKPCRRDDAEAQELVLEQQARRARRRSPREPLRRPRTDSDMGPTTPVRPFGNALDHLGDTDTIASHSARPSDRSSAHPVSLREQALHVVSHTLGSSLGLSPAQIDLLVTFEEARQRQTLGMSNTMDVDEPGSRRDSGIDVATPTAERPNPAPAEIEAPRTDAPLISAATLLSDPRPPASLVSADPPRLPRGTPDAIQPPVRAPHPTSDEPLGPMQRRMSSLQQLLHAAQREAPVIDAMIGADQPTKWPASALLRSALEEEVWPEMRPLDDSALASSYALGRRASTLHWYASKRDSFVREIPPPN